MICVANCIEGSEHKSRTYDGYAATRLPVLRYNLLRDYISSQITQDERMVGGLCRVQIKPTNTFNYTPKVVQPVQVPHIPLN